jgi:hypothetical protein
MEVFFFSSVVYKISSSVGKLAGVTKLHYRYVITMKQQKSLARNAVSCSDSVSSFVNCALRCTCRSMGSHRTCPKSLFHSTMQLRTYRPVLYLHNRDIRLVSSPSIHLPNYVGSYQRRQ